MEQNVTQDKYDEVVIDQNPDPNRDYKSMGPLQPDFSQSGSYYFDSEERSLEYISTQLIIPPFEVLDDAV